MLEQPEKTKTEVSLLSLCYRSRNRRPRSQSQEVAEPGFAASGWAQSLCSKPLLYPASNEVVFAGVGTVCFVYCNITKYLWSTMDFYVLEFRMDSQASLDRTTKSKERRNNAAFWLLIQFCDSGSLITKRICSPNDTFPKFPEQRSFQQATNFGVSYQCRMHTQSKAPFYLRGIYQCFWLLPSDLHHLFPNKRPSIDCPTEKCDAGL